MSWSRLSRARAITSAWARVTRPQEVASPSSVQRRSSASASRCARCVGRWSARARGASHDATFGAPSLVGHVSGGGDDAQPQGLELVHEPGQADQRLGLVIVA